MIGIFPVLYVGWKVIHKTKVHKPEEVDLKKNLDEIEEHEAAYIDLPPE